jgi:hypothetical protein
MKSVLSCDPGVSPLACALAHDRLIVWVGYIVPFRPNLYPRVDDLVCERMIIRQGSAANVSAKRANDLLDVTLSAGWLSGNVAHTTLRWLYPEAWKGQLKKPQHHAMVYDAMAPQERELFAPDTRAYIEAACHRYAVTGNVTGYSRKVHNLLDAVGINFFHTGRMGFAGQPGC